jgi:hypothetical protein
MWRASRSGWKRLAMADTSGWSPKDQHRGVLAPEKKSLEHVVCWLMAGSRGSYGFSHALVLHWGRLIGMPRVSGSAERHDRPTPDLCSDFTPYATPILLVLPGLDPAKPGTVPRPKHRICYPDRSRLRLSGLISRHDFVGQGMI